MTYKKETYQWQNGSLPTSMLQYIYHVMIFIYIVVFIWKQVYILFLNKINNVNI